MAQEQAKSEAAGAADQAHKPFEALTRKDEKPGEGLGEGPDEDDAAAAADARTLGDACTLTMQVLAGSPADVPFALVYLLEDGVARLAASAGIDEAMRLWKPISSRRRCAPANA